MRLAPVHRRRREVGQLVVVPRIADDGGELGILSEAPLPLRVEEGLEPLRFPVRRTLRAGRPGERQEQ